MNSQALRHQLLTKLGFHPSGSDFSNLMPIASRPVRPRAKGIGRHGINKALGTASPDFVRVSLLQLQAAARSPYGKISETAINGALAMIEAAAPRNELEGALAVQMACAHSAAMSVLAKMDSGFGSERRITAFGSTAARLMKAYAMQLEVLRRHRGGGQQFVRVEHVHINAGGQAIIGNVKKQSR